MTEPAFGAHSAPSGAAGAGEIGVALVGTGFWARRLAAAIGRTPSLHLVACYSRDEAKRAAFAAEFGCRAADSLEAMLADSAVEGVLLVTPNHTHLDHTVACAAWGKHVFVEKPIADTLEDGRQMQVACAAAGVTLLVGHAFRRLGAARRARQLLDDGALGRVLLAEANFSLPGSFAPDKWRAHRATCPGGPLMQLGIHHADTLHYLLGPVRRVHGSFARLAVTADVDDVGTALLEFAGGTLAVLAGSYVSPKTFSLRLYGSEANLFYETDMSIWPAAEKMDGATTLTLQTAGGREPVTFEARDMLVEELAEFGRCIRGAAVPETGAAEGLAALQVIRGALTAHEAGRPIDVDSL